MTSHAIIQPKQRRLIGWLLMASLLTLLLVPHHYHLSHVDNPAASGASHQVDLHPFAGGLDTGHFEHDDHTVDASTADMSQPNKLPMPLLALLFILVLLTPLSRSCLLQTYPRTLQRLPSSPRHHLPPLRAPPSF